MRARIEQRLFARPYLLLLTAAGGFVPKITFEPKDGGLNQKLSALGSAFNPINSLALARSSLSPTT
jgi:hypothetical protein